MNEVVTINTESYASMAKAMGLPVNSGERKVNVLNRFRIWHEPTMGIRTMDGKEVKMEVIKGGCYRLEKLEMFLYITLQRKLSLDLFYRDSCIRDIIKMIRSIVSL